MSPNLFVKLQLLLWWLNNDLCWLESRSLRQGILIYYRTLRFCLFKAILSIIFQEVICEQCTILACKMPGKFKVANSWYAIKSTYTEKGHVNSLIRVTAVSHCTVALKNLLYLIGRVWLDIFLNEDEWSVARNLRICFEN